MEAGEAIAGEQRSTSRMPKGVPNSAAMYGICARPLAIAERHPACPTRTFQAASAIARAAPT